jgi:RNA polymerase sigma-70 factor (ECF subfamily)
VDSGGGISPDLLAACQNGDREAWRELYEAHRDRVYSIALHFLHGDSAAAADVTQQVFLKLMDTIGSYRGSASFATWLHRVVVNACLDAGRRSRRSRLVHEPLALETAAAGAAPPDAQISQQETTRTVQEAIATLPPKLRIAILLRYVDDLGYAEMATALNCSIGTVSSRLSRAHRVLAERLKSLSTSAQPRAPGRT